MPQHPQSTFPIGYDYTTRNIHVSHIYLLSSEWNMMMQRGHKQRNEITKDIPQKNIIIIYIYIYKKYN